MKLVTREGFMPEERVPLLLARGNAQANWCTRMHAAAHFVIGTMLVSSAPS